MDMGKYNTVIERENKMKGGLREVVDQLDTEFDEDDDTPKEP